MTSKQIAPLMHTLRASVEELKAVTLGLCLFPPLTPGWALMHVKQLPYWPSAASSRKASDPWLYAVSASTTNLSAFLRSLWGFQSQPFLCTSIWTCLCHLVQSSAFLPSGQTQKPHRSEEEQSEIKPCHPPFFVWWTPTALSALHQHKCLKNTN